MRKDDAFIEGRIRWKVGQYSLPDAHTYFVDEQPSVAAPLLTRVPANNGIGKPILIFAAEGSDWSVLGTKAIGGEIEGVWREVQYRDMYHASFLRGQEGHPKIDFDTLEIKVRGAGQSHCFKSSKGKAFYALWNTCLMLCQVLRRAE